jgi:AmiR/NasT family two-component response regulator
VGRIDTGALQQVMSAYAAAMLRGDEDVVELLYQLTDHCLQVLDLAGAGLALRTPDGDLGFVTATDGRATKVEQVQLETGDGPCYQAFRTGAVVRLCDAETDDRWPAYREACEKVGYRAVLGVPVPVGSHDPALGALNLYADEVRAWTGDELAAASLLSNMAAGYVVTRRSQRASDELAAQLRHALDARVVIEQAKGVLAVRQGIGTAEAFEEIRERARSEQRRVRDVAAELLAGLPD